MKRLFTQLLTLQVLISCHTNRDNQEELLTYSYQEYNILCCTELHLTENQIEYSHTITDSTHTLTYVFFKDSTSADTITYFLKEDKTFEPVYLFNGKKKENDYFSLVNSVKFKIDREYEVYKYSRNTAVSDGCTTHFWSPEIGIILTRSATWGNFRKLRTNNDSINRKIDLLAELIYQDTKFYQGCSEEMELFPKKDVEEFYKWKLNELDALIKQHKH